MMHRAPEPLGAVREEDSADGGVSRSIKFRKMSNSINSRVAF